MWKALKAAFWRGFKSVPPEKPILDAVVVRAQDYRANVGFSKWILIPDGWTFETGFARNPCLKDHNGTVIQEFTWQAGYSIIYEYRYRKEKDNVSESDGAS